MQSAWPSSAVESSARSGIPAATATVVGGRHRSSKAGSTDRNKGRGRTANDTDRGVARSKVDTDDRRRHGEGLRSAERETKGRRRCVVRDQTCEMACRVQRRRLRPRVAKIQQEAEVSLPASERDSRERRRGRERGRRQGRVVRRKGRAAARAEASCQIPRTLFSFFLPPSRSSPGDGRARARRARLEHQRRPTAEPCRSRGGRRKGSPT